MMMPFLKPAEIHLNGFIDKMYKPLLKYRLANKATVINASNTCIFTMITRYYTGCCHFYNQKKYNYSCFFLSQYLSL